MTTMTMTMMFRRIGRLLVTVGPTTVALCCTAASPTTTTSFGSTRAVSAAAFAHARFNGNGNAPSSRFGGGSFGRLSRSLAMAHDAAAAAVRETTTTTTTEASPTSNDDLLLLLPYAESSHNSVTITIPDGGNEINREGFTDRLIETVEHFRRMKKTSVWVEVPMHRAGFVEDVSAADLGFRFHHAEGTTVKLNAWIREDIPSKIPEFATHHVGVGAVVVDDASQRILCIRELRRNYHPWKIPTGLADLGESIESAAEREVLEETGIVAKCAEVLAFRHTHGMAHGRSDLFFICRLIPEVVDDDGNVDVPTPQACEIAEAQWIPLSDYRAMIDGETEESKGHPVMSLVMKRVFDENLSIDTETIESVVPGRRPTPLYFPTMTTTTTTTTDPVDSDSN
mmetsp:Transcript_20990/g.49736  ORF Transcript_20990/g.49736 Transcript_20990/m.49736 type:complete len:397 (+) Transcript_20990:156-1346(+)